MAMRRRDDEVFPNAAGIDIGASSHWVAVPRHLAEQDQQRQRSVAALKRRAASLGFIVTPTGATA